MDLGRFQLGQNVIFGLATNDASGNPIAPDAAPTATVTYPNGSSAGPIKLAMNTGPTTFSIGWFLSADFALGTYTVSYQFRAGSYQGTGSDTFEVIAGGDQGGCIISMYAYDRPEARYVVAQLDSGNLVQGRNPRL